MGARNAQAATLAIGAEMIWYRISMEVGAKALSLTASRPSETTLPLLLTGNALDAPLATILLRTSASLALLSLIVSNAMELSPARYALMDMPCMMESACNSQSARLTQITTRFTKETFTVLSVRTIKSSLSLTRMTMDSETALIVEAILSTVQPVSMLRPVLNARRAILSLSTRKFALNQLKRTVILSLRTAQILLNSTLLMATACLSASSANADYSWFKEAVGAMEIARLMLSGVLDVRTTAKPASNVQPDLF